MKNKNGEFQAAFYNVRYYYYYLFYYYQTPNMAMIYFNNVGSQVGNWLKLFYDNCNVVQLISTLKCSFNGYLLQYVTAENNRP